MVAIISWDDSGATISGITGGGGTWASAVAKQNDGRHNQAFQVWAATNITGATGIVTVTFAGTGPGNRRLTVVEVQDQDLTTIMDATPVFDLAETGTAVDVAITTASNVSLILGHCSADAGTDTIAPDSGFTEIADFTESGNAQQTQYKNVNPGIGATTITWTNSGTADCVAIAIAVRSADTGGGGGSAFPHHYYQQLRRRQIQRRWQRTGRIWMPQYTLRAA